MDDKNKLSLVIFDFGGVLAEEGFRDGLRALGVMHSVPKMFETCFAIAYEIGYAVGLVDEARFWQTVRERTGVNATDKELRHEILSRFVLRPEVMGYAVEVRALGVKTAILSDQTLWLEELDNELDFYRHFDRVFNSYHMGKSKHDATIFLDVCKQMGVPPRETVFIDDSPENIERAQGAGLGVILYTNAEELRIELREHLRKGAINQNAGY